MAIIQAPQRVMVPANADLSASQYRWALVNSSGKLAIVSAAGGDADGILADKPAAADRDSELHVGGISKSMLGGTVTAGDKLQSDGSGDSLLAASGDHVLAKALESGVSGDIISVLIVSKHLLA